MFSVPNPDAVFGLTLMDVFKKELNIYGSFINPDTQQRAVDLINSGKLVFSPMFTHRFPLDQVEQAIRIQAGNESIKVFVMP
ncbi:MAG: hypothetical protein PHX37_01840 [Eubacteriales bacterium]|nr:hypothetical protein [Eubacteriales bacterium]